MKESYNLEVILSKSRAKIAKQECKQFYAMRGVWGQSAPSATKSTCPPTRKSGGLVDFAKNPEILSHAN